MKHAIPFPKVLVKHRRPILRTFQAVFYAFSFFWLDGFARSTRLGRYPQGKPQTVGHFVLIKPSLPIKN
jgi:hypothetical protein